MYKIIDYGTYI